MLATVTLVFLAFTGALCQGDFTGHKLFQAKPQTKEHVEILRSLDENIPEDAIDFWSNPNEETVEFLVSPELAGPVGKVLEEAGVTFRVKFDDIQMLIDEQFRHIRDEEGEFIFRAPGQGRPDPRTDFNLYNYHALDDINDYVSQVQGAFPDLVSVKNLGNTYEGRVINLISVSLDPNNKSNKPAMFMDCGIHAREWVSPAFCLYALDRLVEEGPSGILQQFDFYIIPVANPDGYAYTWQSQGNRMWRKNRRPSSQLLLRSSARQFWPGQGLQGYPGGAGQLGGYLPGYPGASSQSKCWGTDPNRNFDIAHGTVGSSTNPCQDTYHGDSAFSEAESRAVRDALVGIKAAHNGKVAAYFSVHAYSQLWMIPNGHIKNSSPNHNDLMKMAAIGVQSVKSKHGMDFKHGPISQVIYQAAGSSTDWAHSKMGVKYSFALELRDRGQYGFMLPVDQIKPAVEETWAGIEGMAWAILKEY